MSNNKMDNPGGTMSKLALLRQNRSLEKNGNSVDIAAAIDGYASSIDTKQIEADIARNSAHVGLIVDISVSMNGTPYPISQEINEFAKRQAMKLYQTSLSLTLFDDEVYPKFGKQDVKQFVPISPWRCRGGTNIYDALFFAITSIGSKDANHKLHLIITDGQNGHSSHSIEEIRSLIANRINSGEHIFLLYNDETGCLDSAKTYATNLGINPNNAVNFDRSGDGIKIIFQTIEDLLDGLRTNGAIPSDWAKAITAHAANPLGIKARETKYLSYK